jgi:hypothetical protein
VLYIVLYIQDARSTRQNFDEFYLANVRSTATIPVHTTRAHNTCARNVPSGSTLKLCFLQLSEQTAIISL